MGDSDEVMAFGKRLHMNPMEQKKYKNHIQTIRFNEGKTKAWKIMNYFWQILFFSSVFILAFEELFINLAEMNIINTSLGVDAVNFINNWFGRIFWFFIPISFPLMMWSGVVRSKWDGKLTRSTAYALSFLENIEHRQYLEEKRKR